MGVAKLRRLSVIRRPILALRARLTDDARGQLDQQLEWPLFRALVLLMMLQPLRQPGRPERAETLEATVMRPDDDLDEIARAAHLAYQIGRITVRADAALLYPAAGFFPLVALGNDNIYRTAVAIPIGVRHVFLAVPRTIDWNLATTQWAANGAGALANYSVGTSARVVLPPSHMDGFTHEQIARMLNEMRTMSRQLIGLCAERNEALARLDASLRP